MFALDPPQVSKLLDHLFAEAGRNDPAAFDRFDDVESKLSHPASGRLRAESEKMTLQRKNAPNARVLGRGLITAQSQPF
jgi:hypothetical protein